MNSTTKTLVIVGIVGVAAAAGYYFWKKSQEQKAAAAAPPVVDSANDNQRSNSKLADNINAGTNAFNSLTKVFGYGSV